jgi:hypothetical protein
VASVLSRKSCATLAASRRRERGQATVEAIAAIPLLLLAGSIALQLLLAGYALTLADGAAEAGALALAAGRPAREAARAALPDWAQDRAAIAVRGGEVTVRLRPPSPIPALGDRLALASSAYGRPAQR